MPTGLGPAGYRFFFFSNEGNEPPHIPVERGDAYAGAIPPAQDSRRTRERVPEAMD